MHTVLKINPNSIAWYATPSPPHYTHASQFINYLLIIDYCVSISHTHVLWNPWLDNINGTRSLRNTVMTIAIL